VRYSYYPGCSLHGSAVDYQMSIQACCNALKIMLDEIDDWNCCGATAAASEDHRLATLLAARTLAKCSEAPYPIAVSCNACYSRLNQVNAKMARYPEIREEVTAVLAESGLVLVDDYRVKHLLEIFCEDMGLDRLKEQVSQPLINLKVIPYYGCQMVRPRAYDHPEQPTSLDNILTTIGAQVLPFHKKTKCCGAALISTNEPVALKLVQKILDEASQRGADVIAVSCPLCQMNLDAFQDKVNSLFGTAYKLPVVYFTQLVGLSLGISVKKLGLDRGIVPAMPVLRTYL